jgi:hypothetical protein
VRKDIFPLRQKTILLWAQFFFGQVCRTFWRRKNVEETIKKLSDTTGFYNNGIAFPFCDRIVGVTDIINLDRRGFEIAKWIKDNQFTGKYVILDDMYNCMLQEQKPYLITTDLFEGLTENDVEKAIKILNE